MTAEQQGRTGGTAGRDRHAREQLDAVARDSARAQVSRSGSGMVERITEIRTALTELRADNERNARRIAWSFIPPLLFAILLSLTFLSPELLLLFGVDESMDEPHVVGIAAVVMAAMYLPWQFIGWQIGGLFLDRTQTEKSLRRREEEQRLYRMRVLEGSGLAVRDKYYVQDPYAFRCAPQVHGASWDAIRHTERVFLTEANSVTDNPNIFPDSDAILSGGNFHAQPLALVLDYLAIALAELGSISERRTYQLISGARGLPSFLTAHAGLNSGLMIPQYTAASIASQNKQLCTPASVDSIVSSNGQEDHVSMAANAATKCYRVAQNLERILAIEWMTAAQAMEFRRPSQSSPAIERRLEQYRQIVPVLEEDRVLHEDMVKTVAFLRGAFSFTGLWT